MLNKIYEIVEKQYFDSGDFNGMPIYGLTDDFDVESEEFRSAIRSAIERCLSS